MYKAIHLFLFFFPLYLLSQEGTTLEEYRYLTRGYAYQIQMGLDAQKDGYDIRPLYTSSNKVRFTGLYFKNDAQLRAIVAVVRPNSDSPQYLCIPNPASAYEITSKSLEDLSALGEADRDLFDHAQREWLYAYVQNQTGELAASPEIEAKARENAVASEQPAENPEFTEKGIRAIPETYEIRRESAPTAAPPASTTPSPATVSLHEANVELGGEIQDRLFQRKPLIIPIEGQYGKVALKVCVEPNGKVSSVKFTQRGSTTMSEILVNSAIKSAEESVFQSVDFGTQCGIMVFDYN